MEPKFSVSSQSNKAVTNKIETFPRFEMDKVFDTLKSKLRNYKLEYTEKQNITDRDLLYLKKITSAFADVQRDKNISPDRFSKFIETFPAILRDVLPSTFDFSFSKTELVLDVLYGVDAIVKFKDGTCIGFDFTSNIKVGDVLSLGDKKYNKYQITGTQNTSSEPTFKNNFLNVVLPIDQDEFLFAFYNLSQNTKLNFKQVYLVLFKRFYIDRLYKFLTIELTNSKEKDFNIVRENFLEKDIYRYFGTRNIDEIADEKKYLFVLLANLYETFYNNPEVLKLKELGF